MGFYIGTGGSTGNTTTGAAGTDTGGTTGIDGEGKSDSVHVGINGTLAGAAAMQGFPTGGWAWSNATRGKGFATVQVNAPGQHVIDVWMREDGFEIDARLLTTDTDYVPSGKPLDSGAMTCCYPRENNVKHIWTYTPASNTWQQSAEIPQARRRGSAATVVHDGKIYLVGGNTLGHDGGAVNWFDQFNPSTGIWRVLPNAPVARDHAQGGLTGDTLVLAAGRRTAQPNVFANTVARVDVYDFATNSWTEFPALSLIESAGYLKRLHRKKRNSGGRSVS